MKYLITIIIILIIPFSLLSQNEKKQEKSKSFERVSDDMKFSNGVNFIKLGNNKKAMQELHEYLEIYLNGTHRHEALQHIAEMHFKNYDYLKAIAVYKKLYEEFSSTEEGLKAFFTIGLCYKKIGYDDKAMRVFKTLVKNYPGTSYAFQAKLQLNLLEIIKN